MGPPCPVPGASIPEDSHLHWISFRGAGHLINPELAPISGGLTSLHLVFDYTPPLTGVVVTSNFGTDLNGNPDWNEAVSPGASWDCNVLNSQDTAPRATSPARIICDATDFANHPFSGTEHLATFSFNASSTTGTTTMSWNIETEMVAGSDGLTCADIACEGATITIVP
jgi:hypothetical protein